jgi:hypothetical protein
MPRLRRLAASLTLVSVLACSGLGLCWQTLASLSHACCEHESAAPARSCSAVGTKVAAPELAPPTVAVLTVSPWLTRPLMEQAVSAFAPAFAVHPPPLVLRI